jgi:hypothetical protein
MIHGIDFRLWLLAAAGIVIGISIAILVPEARAASGAITAGIIALVVLKHLGILIAVVSPFGALVRARNRRAAEEDGSR